MVTILEEKMTTYYLNDVMAYAQKKSEQRLRSLEHECDHFKVALETFVKRYSCENSLSVDSKVLSEKVTLWKSEVEDIYFDIIEDEMHNGTEREVYHIYDHEY